MQHKKGATRMGYHAHYVVDGGKARDPERAGHPCGRTRTSPCSTCSSGHASAGGPGCAGSPATPNTAPGDRGGCGKASIRAYVSMADFEKKSPTTARRFVYEPEKDLYRCPRGNPCACTPTPTRKAQQVPCRSRNLQRLPLKPECTPGDSGRVLMRSFDEEILKRVRAYRDTGPYEKALRKRKVWVEPCSGKPKSGTG